MKFEEIRIGDLVKANQLSNDNYIFTTLSSNWEGEITNVDTKHKTFMSGRFYDLDPKCFDLVSRGLSQIMPISGNKKINPFDVVYDPNVLKMKSEEEIDEYFRLKITERGWPAHYICAESCTFRRNTLIEYADLKWVVSTVGRQHPLDDSDDWVKIGRNRYYETMAFKAKQNGIYWDADTSNPIDFDSAWAIHDCAEDSEFRANEMHDKVVAELSEKIKNDYGKGDKI